MKITTKTIRDLNLCAEGLDNFLRHYPEFDGTHEDFLILENVSHERKLWVILRLMSRFDVEVFAIDCAAHASCATANSDTYEAYAAACAAACAAADVAYATYATHAADAAATASASSAAFYAAAYVADAAERERQLAAIEYLINKSEELNEN